MSRSHPPCPASSLVLAPAVPPTAVPATTALASTASSPFARSVTSVLSPELHGDSLNALPLILTVFVACVVEAVEALTIVLAVGITREWKSTYQGMRSEERR